MQRRTLIQTFLAWAHLQGSRIQAQAPAFPGTHEASLKDLAATVLPESLGRAATDKIALDFVRWVQEYRAGAEMQTGYGTTRVRYKPVFSAVAYVRQLELLASGALTQKSLGAKRAKIAETFTAANIKDLPFVPDGVNIAADLMTFYFQSSEANDLLYNAAIGKDKCRTLKNSSGIPAPLKKEGTAHAAI